MSWSLYKQTGAAHVLCGLCKARSGLPQVTQIEGVTLYNLVVRLLPSFLSHTVQKTGREPWKISSHA